MRTKVWGVAVMAAVCLSLAAGPVLAEQYNPNRKRNQGSQASQQRNKGQQGALMGQQNKGPQNKGFGQQNTGQQKSIPQGGPGTSPLVTYGSGGN